MVTINKKTLKTIKKIREELKDLPKGSQLHFYEYYHIFRPRGHMKKESLGEYILEKLSRLYESWTDDRYCDRPSKSELLRVLQQNMKEEVDGAWREFIKRINTRDEESS